MQASSTNLIFYLLSPQCKSNTERKAYFPNSRRNQIVNVQNQYTILHFSCQVLFRKKLAHCLKANNIKKKIFGRIHHFMYSVSFLLQRKSGYGIVKLWN